jgi:hypothetical protein
VQSNSVAYIIRGVYPDVIQTDSDCMLSDRFVADPRDTFSVLMKDQYLDLGAATRQMATLTHA